MPSRLPAALTLPELLAALWCAAGAASDVALLGLPIAEAIRQLAGRELQVVYSSAVVTPGLRVTVEPAAGQPRQRLEQLLAAHGLALREMASGRLVVVRAAAESTPPPASTPPASTAQSGPPIVAEPPVAMVVTGSRYRFDRLSGSDAFAIFAADLERLPDLGDDPLRAIARLPGAATGGFSARSSIRGGDVDETLVHFDGFRLHNPFHLKDFQSVFSTVDPALVRSIDVHTGGFPVAFGDRMSGVIDIEPLSAPSERVGSVALGLFSAGLLFGDRIADGRGDWLVSARRGNLDLLLDAIDPSRGRPHYFDLHARLGAQVSDDLALRGSLLHFEDDIDISDSDQEEQARARYRDAYYWLGADWTPRPGLLLHSRLGLARLESERRGSAEQPGVSTGSLEDERSTEMLTLDLHGRWLPDPHWQLDAGLEYRRDDGHYRYRDAVQFDLLFATAGAPTEPERMRDLEQRASGEHLAAWVAAQRAFDAGLTLDLGLRYDYDTLTEDDEGIFSPRLGLAWRAGPHTELKLAWGRFAQSQTAMETLIADGVLGYAPMQRADHVLLGLRHAFGAGVELRADAYQKRYSNLRPRFENLLNSFVLLPELKPDRVRVDVDEARARGLELTLQSAEESALNWWVNYNWSEVSDRIAGAQVLRSWDQTHAVGAGVGWRSERWDLSAALGWRSGWPTTPVALASLEPIAVATVGARNSERLGAYFTLDLRAARRFVFDGSVLTVFLELTNATNRRNPCCVDYEIDDEEAEPFLELDTEPYLPTLPNLGFVWEF